METKPGKAKHELFQNPNQDQCAKYPATWPDPGMWLSGIRVSDSPGDVLAATGVSSGCPRSASVVISIQLFQSESRVLESSILSECDKKRRKTVRGFQAAWRGNVRSLVVDHLTRRHPGEGGFTRGIFLLYSHVRINT